MQHVQPADVTAVVAAYRPDDDVAVHVARLAGQVGHTIVVDDGSGIGWDRFYARLAADHPHDVTVKRSEQNRGIAHALNLGVQGALQQGCTAVVTFDQDSTAADDYVASMVWAANRLSAAGRPFGALAAGVQSGAVVRPVGRADRGHAVTPTREAIQSGLFIPAVTFERTGVFDESLFIDCVDTDFIARAAAIGLPTFLNRASAIDHPLGQQLATNGVRVTRGGARSFAFHPAWRRYYISRNRTVMLGRHGTRAPLQAAVGLAGETAQLARCLLFGPHKLQQGAAVTLGVIDAIRGRRGRFSDTTAALLSAPR